MKKEKEEEPEIIIDKDGIPCIKLKGESLVEELREHFSNFTIFPHMYDFTLYYYDNSTGDKIQDRRDLGGDSIKFIGTKKTDIDKTPIDYFSIGHIIFGFITYLICLLAIITFSDLENFREYALISTIIVGILWELVENNWLLNTKLKINHQRDSLENCLFDVLFVFGGGIICQVFSYFEIVDFIIATFIFLVISIIMFEVCSTITINNS